jgi:hypothetical protein
MSWQAWMALAEAASQLSPPTAEGLEAAGTAVRLAPAVAEVHFALGLAAHRLGQFGLAGRGYAEALKRDPAHGPSLHNLSLMPATGSMDLRAPQVAAGARFPRDSQDPEEPEEPEGAEEAEEAEEADERIDREVYVYLRTVEQVLAAGAFVGTLARAFPPAQDRLLGLAVAFGIVVIPLLALAANRVPSGMLAVGVLDRLGSDAPCRWRVALFGGGALVSVVALFAPAMATQRIFVAITGALLAIGGVLGLATWGTIRAGSTMRQRPR